MKKRWIGLLVAAALTVQPLTALAAGSISSRPTGNSSSSSRRTQELTTGKLEQNTVQVVQTPVQQGGTGTGTADTVKFITDQNALREAGFSWDVIEKINTINAGTEPLYRTIGTTDMVGYVPLAPVQTLVAGDETTTTLYLANLTEGLKDLQIVYYNLKTHIWEKAAPTSINYATKEITLNLSGTTPFTVVYKK